MFVVLGIFRLARYQKVMNAGEYIYRIFRDKKILSGGKLIKN
jgi:hypothetical protein